MRTLYFQKISTKEDLSPTHKALLNLCQPIKRKGCRLLNSEQEKKLKYLIINKILVDVGIDAYIWTAPIISKYVEDEFNVKYAFSSIYDVLKRLNLSHQRAHQDYSNADKKEQEEFIEKIKKKKIVLKKKK